MTIYILAIAIYLAIIAYRDYETILFDESWLYKYENIQTNFGRCAYRALLYDSHCDLSLQTMEFEVDSRKIMY